MMESPASTSRGSSILRLFDDADGEAGHVEFARGVDGGHFGGFAAEQGAAGLHAAVGDALDDFGGGGGVEGVEGEVVEEEEGFAALDDEVVDVHGNEVDADGVVFFEGGGDFDFGADAVGAGDEDGVFVVAAEEFFGVVEAEEAGEAAVFAEDTRVEWVRWQRWRMRSTMVSPAAISTPASL